MVKNKGWFKKGYSYWRGKKRGTSGMKGKKHPKSWKIKMRKMMKGRVITWGDKISKAKKGIPHLNQRGPYSYKWAGDKIGKGGVHIWVKSILGTPMECEHCGRTDRSVYDWANKDHTYRRIMEDYMRLCRSCHRKWDIKYNRYRTRSHV